MYRYALLLLALIAMMQPNAAKASLINNVFINELHYDNSGADIDEFIELAGPTGLDLTGWYLLLYNGSSGQLYRNISLTGAYFLDQGLGIGLLDIAVAPIQNGPSDAIALFNNNDQLLQFLSYEGVVVAIDGAAAGLSSTDIGVSENSSPLGYSLQLGGSGRLYQDFSWQSAAPNSRGKVNTAQRFLVRVDEPDSRFTALALVLLLLYRFNRSSRHWD